MKAPVSVVLCYTWNNNSLFGNSTISAEKPKTLHCRKPVLDQNDF